MQHGPIKSLGKRMANGVNQYPTQDNGKTNGQFTLPHHMK